jgi:CRISPR-associated protein Csa3
VRTYVSTLGFHETRVTRPILRNDLDAGDAVILLRPANEADDERGANAVDYVEDMLHEIEPEATVTVEQVDVTDFETAVLECSDVLLAAEGTVIVNMGGGAREVFLPFAIATVANANHVDRALQYTDIDQDVQEWHVPNLTAQLSDNARETLALIEELGGATVPELTDASEKSKSTVTRHVNQLEGENAVTTRREGKTKHVEILTTGRLLVTDETG